MPIPVASVDDRTYADLVAEAVDLIKVYAPEWTDHSPSDPGIAIVELLAWLTEMLIYQVDQVPAGHHEAFLRLLNGPEWRRGPAGVDADTRSTLRRLREPFRAVTPADYEYLVRNAGRLVAADAAAPTDLAILATDEATMARVQVLPERDLTVSAAGQKAAHVSVIVVPRPVADAAGARDELSHPEPSSAVIGALQAFLDERRLLATQVHVVGPHYMSVGLTVDVALRNEAPLKESSEPNALEQIRDRLREYLSPLRGGREHTGWPLGRSVYASEIYALVHEVGAVEYVTNVALTADPSGTAVDSTADEIAVADHQLVRLTALDLEGLDVTGKRWPLQWRSDS